MRLTLRTLNATRYITPLREGGSLPAIIEADDDQQYVLKFRGAGQGIKALIAELVAGEIFRALSLPIPEIVLVELDSLLGRSEPDPEIRDLINASSGLNLAMVYLAGAFGFDPLLPPPPQPDLASAIVWCDAFLTNVDRTPRNPNILMWQQQLWLIDHGAALYFHHTWNDYLTRSRSPFVQVKDHVLLPFASKLAEVDTTLTAHLTRDLLQEIVALIPTEWLNGEAGFATAQEHRAAYLSYLLTRLESPRPFVEEALRAHAQHL
jgi:hypothetical protein